MTARQKSDRRAKKRPLLPGWAGAVLLFEAGPGWPAAVALGSVAGILGNGGRAQGGPLGAGEAGEGSRPGEIPSGCSWA